MADPVAAATATATVTESDLKALRRDFERSSPSDIDTLYDLCGAGHPLLSAGMFLVEHQGDGLPRMCLRKATVPANATAPANAPEDASATVPVPADACTKSFDSVHWKTETSTTKEGDCKALDAVIRDLLQPDDIERYEQWSRSGHPEFEYHPKTNPNGEVFLGYSTPRESLTGWAKQVGLLAPVTSAITTTRIVGGSDAAVRRVNLSRVFHTRGPVAVAAATTGSSETEPNLVALLRYWNPDAHKKFAAAAGLGAAGLGDNAKVSLVASDSPLNEHVQELFGKWHPPHFGDSLGKSPSTSDSDFEPWDSESDG